MAVASFCSAKARFQDQLNLGNLEVFNNNHLQPSTSPIDQTILEASHYSTFGITMLSHVASLAVIMATLLPLTHAQERGPTCRELVVPVTIKGRNINIPDGGLSFVTMPNILSGLVQGLFQTVNLFDGEYNIAGRYCEPEVTIARRRDTLQLLLHPATYDRNYVGTSAISKRIC